MTTRAKKLVQLLTAANGRWIDSDTLAEGLGISKTSVAAAVTEARGVLGYPIETHKIRGVGWRLAPDAPVPDKALPGARLMKELPPVSPELAAALAKPSQEAPLSRNGAIMLDLLTKAGGAFVSGKQLSDPMGIYPSELGRVAKHIMTKRPHLRIEGQRGEGYRLVTGEVAKLPPALPKHQAHRTVLELLAALAPRTAELVRDIALETNQTPGAAIERLLSYGIEVHRDLVVHGEHPLTLGRAA